MGEGGGELPTAREVLDEYFQLLAILEPLAVGRAPDDPVRQAVHRLLGRGQNPRTLQSMQLANDEAWEVVRAELGARENAPA